MSKKDFSLIVSIPGEDPARHDLSGDSITVGRGPDNGIQVLVSEVSVQHGALNATEESYRIVDNGSTNGTKVNGTPVGDGVELSPMDRILLGDTVPAYFVPSAILEATPVAEVVASIEERAKESPAPVATQPAAPAAPAAPVVKPAVALPGQAPAAGAQTVKLDQVKPGAPAPGPARPAPAAPKLPTPGGGAPAAPRPVAPIPLKKPGGPGAATIPLPKTPPKPGE
jgi:hypothetical protein